MAMTPPPLELPPLPLDEWEDSKDTLHLFVQIVGKVRLRLHPKLNHWWHVTLYVSPRGLTTRAIPYGGASFEIAFDLIEHVLRITTSRDEERSFPIDSLSVAQFYERLFAALAELGIEALILARPYEHKSQIPFAEDHEHEAYDRERVQRYWRILVGVNNTLETFRSRFLGKRTPVHLFWHSFDLALTRFSGRPAPEMTGGSASDREAYSHEVISVGFWAGDQNLRAPALYSYTYPEPDGLKAEPLRPASASWIDQRGSAMALLMYDDLRAERDPRAALLDFFQSAYEAGAKRAGWDRSALEPASTGAP
jgi:hypothetical protein